LPVIQRFADWAGKNTDQLVKLTYVVGGTTAAIVALNFAMNANPVVAFTTYTIAATAAIAGLRAQFQNLVLPVRAAIDQISRMLSPLLGIIDAYNALAGMVGLPKITIGKTSTTSTPGTLGPPAAVTGGANRLVPSLPSIPSISPAGVSGSRSGGRSGGMALSDGGGSGPSFSSLGLALDLSNYQPPADFLAGYDPFAGMGFTINVNGGLATSAEIGNAVVDAIKQYTNVSGPADIAIR
jgi:hypothetical protein